MQPTPFFLVFIIFLLIVVVIYSQWQVRRKTKALTSTLSEKEKLHRALQANEEKFRLLFQKNPEAITLTALDGRILDANNVFYRTMGYRPEDIIDRTTVDLRIWNDEADRKKFIKSLEKNGSVRNMKAEFIRKDGEIVSELVSAVPVDIDNKPHILTQGRNITEQLVKEKERILLAKAIEQSSDAVLLTDAEGKILYVNPAFEKSSGYSSDEVRGKTPRILKSGNQSREFYEKLWQTNLSGKTWKGQLTNRKKNGGLYQENITISPVKDKDGIITNFVAVKQDITSEQTLQLQLQQAQKHEAIGTLAGGIAHDFNNILGAILGYAEMIKMDLPEESQSGKDIAEVISSAQRAVDLVKQILTFSRQNSEEFQPVQIQFIVKETLKLLKASLPSTITLQQMIDSSCDPILGDPVQLHQVLINLFTNAKEALKDAKGMISVSVKQLDLNESDKVYDGPNDLPAGSYVALEVTDNGCGMDMQTMAQVFDPFYSTKNKGQGTGLGMAVSHGIIKQHGGTITVTSAPGEQTTFRILLPVVEPSTEMSAQPAFASPPRGSERIVLVDDEKFLVEVVQRELTGLGYTVQSFTDSQQALSWMQNNLTSFDLLLTDMTMPEMTGADLAAQVLRLRPELPVIVCSGFSEVLSRDEALALGIRDYLPKPVTRMQLANKLDQVLHP